MIYNIQKNREYKANRVSGSRTTQGSIRPNDLGSLRSNDLGLRLPERFGLRVPERLTLIN